MFNRQIYYIRNNDLLNLQEIWDEKLDSEKQTTPTAITTLTRLGIQSYRDWRACAVSQKRERKKKPLFIPIHIIVEKLNFY